MRSRSPRRRSPTPIAPPVRRSRRWAPPASQRAASEARVEGSRLRGEELCTRSLTELDSEPSGLAALAGVTGDGPLPGAVEVERRLDNLRQERERLGAVNLRADEELDEVLDSRDKLSPSATT